MSIITMVKAGLAVVKTFAVVNAPIIFIGAAAVGVVSTAVIAWKAGKKSSMVLGKAKVEKGEPLTKVEKVKATWKLWLPVCVSIILTFGCMGASYYIHSVRLAEATSMANALMVSNKQLNDELAMINEVSPDISKSALSERINTDLKNGTKYHDTGTGTDKFFDRFSGQYFLASVEWVSAGIKKYQNEWRYLKRGKELTMSRFYNIIQVPAQFYEFSHILCFSKTLDTDMFQVPNIEMEWQPLYKDTDIEDGIWILNFYPPNYTNFRFTTEYGLDEDEKMPSYVDKGEYDDYLEDNRNFGKYQTYSAL